MTRPAAREGNRSVSVALSYILVLGISTILITGLLIAGGTFVGDNREQVIDSELAVIGNHVAGNMEQVDRMANATQHNVGDSPEVASVNQSFQRLVTGSSYTVEVVDGDPAQVVLTATDPDVSVSVNATLHGDVRETTVIGGPISVYYDDDSDEVVVADA